MSARFTPILIFTQIIFKNIQPKCQNSNKKYLLTKYRLYRYFYSCQSVSRLLIIAKYYRPQKLSINLANTSSRVRALQHPGTCVNSSALAALWARSLGLIVRFCIKCKHKISIYSKNTYIHTRSVRLISGNAFQFFFFLFLDDRVEMYFWILYSNY